MGNEGESPRVGDLNPVDSSGERHMDELNDWSTSAGMLHSVRVGEGAGEGKPEHDSMVGEEEKSILPIVSAFTPCG